MNGLIRTRLLDRLEACLDYVAVSDLTAASRSVRIASLLSSNDGNVKDDRYVDANGRTINRRPANIYAAVGALTSSFSHAEEARNRGSGYEA